MKRRHQLGSLDGKVAIITGAGRGIGRNQALFLASEGAKIVVNDLGGNTRGSGADIGPANEVVEEIRAMGGKAVADAADVTDWEATKELVQRAVDTFGNLHILINNAGVFRDRTIVKMTEEDWDLVVDVHMKGHFLPTRWAAVYWRDQAKAGVNEPRAIVNTASGAMLGNVGQYNYSGAKAAIAAMTLAAAAELRAYGVRVNCIAPLARTRAAEETPFLQDIVAAPDDPAQFDKWNSANIAPMVAYLCSPECLVSGGVFHVAGSEVGLYRGWSLEPQDVAVADERWSLDILAEAVEAMVGDTDDLASEATPMIDLITAFGHRSATHPNT